jgi:hypothetical protein
MSDPKSNFLAAVGRMAGASGNTPPAAPDRFHQDADFLRRMANHKQLDWLIPDRERVLRIANVLTAVPDEIDAMAENYEAAQSSLASQLSTMETQLAEARDVIAASATDFIGTRDILLNDPLCKERLPNTIGELGETGEWLRAYVSDAPSAVKSLAERLNKAERELSTMESAKNAAMTLAYEREAEIKRLERDRDHYHKLYSQVCGENDAVIDFLGTNDRDDPLVEHVKAEVARLREALYQCDTVMMIVEPRSHKAEYLAALRQAKAAQSRTPSQALERMRKERAIIEAIPHCDCICGVGRTVATCAKNPQCQICKLVANLDKQEPSDAK